MLAAQGAAAAFVAGSAGAASSLSSSSAPTPALSVAHGTAANGVHWRDQQPLHTGFSRGVGGGAEVVGGSSLPPAAVVADSHVDSLLSTQRVSSGSNSGSNSASETDEAPSRRRAFGGGFDDIDASGVSSAPEESHDEDVRATGAGDNRRASLPAGDSDGDALAPLVAIMNPEQLREWASLQQSFVFQQ